MTKPNSMSRSDVDEQLLMAAAEQLKVPLLQVSQHIELARMGGEINSNHLENVTDMGLQLIESYLLSMELSREQGELQLEPVSISSVLQTTVERLHKIAREYNCNLELRLSGRYGPVMGHRPSLEAAMTSLGYSFIEAQQSAEVKNPRLILAAHRSRWGIVAGTYGEHSGLTSDMFRRAKLLQGRACQGLPGFAHTSGAGIFVADSLLGVMASKLHVSHHAKLTGLAVTLAPNPQLELV